MTSVAVIRYEGEKSVEEAIRLSGAFDGIVSGDRVFIKPNIVFWSTVVQMPPFGVITTTRVMEPVVRLLSDLGVKEMVIGESPVTTDPKAEGVAAHAFEALGYLELAKKYGVKVVDLFEGAFRPVEVANGISLNFSEAFLDADAVVNLPVLKTHAQTKVSLGIKNLKGCIDQKSRKICHSACLKNDLDFHVAKIGAAKEKIITVMDGIYTLERGPGFSGKARRSDLIVASSNMLAADITGAALLGFSATEIPHIKALSQETQKPCDGSWFETKGLTVSEAAAPHRWDFPYNEEGTLPLGMAKAGITGLTFPKYDHSLCTYCSAIIGLLQFGLGAAYKGEPFDNVEVLTGKIRKPSQSMNHTLLLGKCQVVKHKSHPNINHAICVPGCPPDLGKLVQGVKEAGIELDENLFAHFDYAPAMFMAQYEGRDEFSLNDFSLSG